MSCPFSDITNFQILGWRIARVIWPIIRKGWSLNGKKCDSDFIRKVVLKRGILFVFICFKMRRSNLIEKTPFYNYYRYDIIKLVYDYEILPCFSCVNICKTIFLIQQDLTSFWKPQLICVSNFSWISGWTSLSSRHVMKNMLRKSIRPCENSRK